MKSRNYTVEAGEYRQYCTLQRRKGSDVDTSGGREPKFEDEISFWGKITPFFGYETSNTGAQKGSVSHNIETRYDALVVFKAGKRIVHNNRVFAITGIVNVSERDRKMRVQCVEQSGVN